MLKKFNNLDNGTQLVIIVITILSSNKLMELCNKLIESKNQNYVNLGVVFVVLLLCLQGIGIFLGFKAMKKLYSDFKSRINF